MLECVGRGLRCGGRDVEALGGVEAPAGQPARDRAAQPGKHPRVRLERELERVVERDGLHRKQREVVIEGCVCHERAIDAVGEGRFVAAEGALGCVLQARESVLDRLAALLDEPVGVQQQRAADAEGIARGLIPRGGAEAEWQSRALLHE